VGILAALALATAAHDAAATGPGENGGIAFRRYFDKDHSAGAIFVMASDGTSSRQITRPPRGFLDQNEDWAPNGALLVFQRCSATTPCAIYTVKPDGTQLKRLSWAPGTSGRLMSDDQAATFTPDGRHVLFTRASGGIHPKVDQIKHSDLVVMDLSGNNRRIVLRAPQYKADYENASFSPDSSKLVYEHRRSQLVDPQTRRALIVSSANGKHQQQITPWSLNAGDGADWSPDATHLLFRSYDDDNEQTQSQLYTIRPDGTELRQLTRFAPGTALLSASFSPDGQQIVFAMGGKSGKADIFVMNADGTEIRPLLQHAAWDSSVDWGSS
jgi:Tol biopolymer transport system component